MITKLSRMDSSSSSLKYSTSTETRRWRKRMISAAFVFRFDSARTIQGLFIFHVNRLGLGPLTIQVRMPNVHIVHTFPGETWRNLLAFLLEIKDYWQETFNVGCRYVIAI